MPVSSDKLFTKKRAIVQSEAKKAGLTAYFPLDERPDGFELSSAIQDLRDCQFVIADLSLERPSCYFELGLAQALDKPTILIAEKGTSVHQASGRSETTYYQDLEEYQRVISKILTVNASLGTYRIA